MKRSRSPWWVVVVLLVVHLDLWVALGAEMVYFVPKMKQTYANFGMSLSAGSQALIAASDWFVNYWYVVALGPVLFDLGALLVLHLVPAPRWVRVVWSVLVIALLLALLLWGLFTYLTEMSRLKDALGR
jgi:type II secretory pathway component PulF